MNKANADYDAMVAPKYAKWVEALDRFCPPRNAIIDGLEQKRAEAIAMIEAEYQKEYDAVMESFNNLMKPTQDALDQIRDKSWEIYGDSIMGKNFKVGA